MMSACQLGSLCIGCMVMAHGFAPLYASTREKDRDEGRCPHALIGSGSAHWTPSLRSKTWKQTDGCRSQITVSISLDGRLSRPVRYRFGDVEDNSSFLERQSKSGSKFHIFELEKQTDWESALTGRARGYQFPCCRR